MLRDETTKAVDCERSGRKLPLRERLTRTINYSQEQIKFLEQTIKESKDALELLNKNKNVETIVNLLSNGANY